MAEVGPTTWNATAAIKRCRTLEWSGEVFRCHSRKYAGDDPGGSFRTTGRFNRGTDKFPVEASWPAPYTSTAMHVALGERVRHTSPGTLQRMAGQRISTLLISLRAVLMGCDRDRCSNLGIDGISFDQFCHPSDYVKTHDIARCAREVAEGMLIPSCTRFNEGNLIVFPDRLHATSSIHVVETVDPDLYIDWSTWGENR